MMDHYQPEFRTEVDGEDVPAMPLPTPVIPDSDLEVDDVPIISDSPAKEEELKRNNQHKRSIDLLRHNATLLCLLFSSIMLAIFGLVGVFWHTPGQQEAFETFKIIVLTSLGFFIGNSKSGE